MQGVKVGTVGVTGSTIFLLCISIYEILLYSIHSGIKS